MSLSLAAGDTVLLSLQPIASHTPKGKILELLETVARIPSRDVGRIEQRGRGALVALPRESGAKAVELLDGAVFDDRVLAADLRSSGEKPGRKSRSTTDLVSDHFDNLLELLEIEAQAAARRTLDDMRQLDPKTAERYGQTLVGLVLAEENVGLGGPHSAGLPQARRGEAFAVDPPVCRHTRARHRRGGARRAGRIAESSADATNGRSRSRSTIGRHRTANGLRSAWTGATTKPPLVARRPRLERTRLAPKGRLAELRDTLLGCVRHVRRG